MVEDITGVRLHEFKFWHLHTLVDLLEPVSCVGMKCEYTPLRAVVRVGEITHIKLFDTTLNYHKHFLIF